MKYGKGPIQVVVQVTAAVNLGELISMSRP